MDGTFLRSYIAAQLLAAFSEDEQMQKHSQISYEDLKCVEFWVQALFWVKQSEPKCMKEPYRP